MAAVLPASLLCVVCIAAAAPAASAATCPPLRSSSVIIECSLRGRPVDCTGRASAPDTLATFRCRRLHHFPFDFLPANGYESRCQAGGDWSVQPFRCVPICGNPVGKGAPLVRDGKPVSSGAEYPWHVTVYDMYANMKQICGGSLITPGYFVSAAHCFHDNVQPQPAAGYLAALGKTERRVDVREPNAQYRQVKAIHIHNDYGKNKLQYTNDISLVELDGEIDITSWALPLCVDWARKLPALHGGEVGTVVGFGGRPGQPSDKLQSARLPFVQRDECRKRVTDKLAVYSVLEDKFCVGFVNNTTVGYGDSGGGMAFPADDRRWFLRGVVSVGLPADVTFSFFSNVTKFVPWISSIIRRGEVTGRRCGVDVDDVAVIDGGQARREDFPWEVNIYHQKLYETKFRILWSGVLVKSNLVITARVHTNSFNGPTNLGSWPAAALRVTPRWNTEYIPTGAVNVSEVLRTFIPYEVQQQSGLGYNVILLELKEHLQLMPACVDWGGGTLMHDPQTATALDLVGGGEIWRRFAVVRAEACQLLKASPVDGHDICVEYRDGPQPLSLSPILMVNVDNSWFVRGIINRVAHGTTDTVTMYTDMNDPVVRQWLTKTRAMLGTPVCGDVDLCEPLTPGLSLTGHMPWNVAVVVGDDSGARAEYSGLLVNSNTVLTDSAHVLVQDQGGAERIAPVKDISVSWLSKDGSSKRSSVALVHAYSVADKLGELVLLELHPNNAIPNTPVCLDLSGTELPTLRSGELGLVHTWTKWSGGNHSLVGAAYVNRADCSKLLQQRANVFPYSPRTQFCTKMDKDSVDPKVQGGGFLVRSGSKWFLQGLYKKTIDFHRSTLVVAADVSNEEIRIFLSTALQNIRHVTTEASVSETKERQGCMGKRLQSSKVCGQFVPRNEYGVPDAADVYYLDHPSSNHMEWYVYVVSHLSRRVRQTQVGALIHPKMVLASSWKLLVTEEDETDDSSVQQKAVPAHDIAVRYFPAANGRVVLDAEVERVVLRERAEGFPTFFLYDYALLELKSAVNLMPVCLPPPGRDMLPLGEGVRGLVEADDGAIMTLVPFTSRLNDECNEDDLVHNVTEDSFCAYSHLQMRDGSSMIHGGAPFSVLEDGVWYLKGMMGEMLRFKNGTDDSYSFVEVKDGRMMYSFLGLDSDVLSWIASIVPEAPSASSAASGLRHQFASAAGTDATDKPVIATASIRKSLVPPTAKPYRTLATSMATSTGPMPHVTVTSVPKTTTRKPTAVKQISSTASILKNSTIVPNVKPTPVSVGTDPSPSSVADSNSSSLCGRNTLPLKQLANASLPGHLPWSVMVFVRNHSDVAVNAGVLVRDDLVLTATNLLRSPARNGEAAGSIDASRLRVMWISQFGSRHWSDVIAVHVRRGVARQYDADVAVLELTTPFKRSMLPCLDLESPSRALAQLHPGQTGVEETWSADLSKQHVVRTVLQTCRVSVSQPRTLCGNGPTGMGHVGAAFLVLKRGAWHLLGIRVTGSTVMDVSESPIRSWLQDRLASEPSLSSALFFAD